MSPIRDVIETTPVPDLSDWRDSVAFDRKQTSLSESLGVYFPSTTDLDRHERGS